MNSDYLSQQQIPDDEDEQSRDIRLYRDELERSLVEVLYGDPLGGFRGGQDMHDVTPEQKEFSEQTWHAFLNVRQAVRRSTLP